MHRRTYERLHRAYEKARDRCIQGMLAITADEVGCIIR
jgi:hypothetical protein